MFTIKNKGIMVYYRLIFVFRISEVFQLAENVILPLTLQ